MRLTLGLLEACFQVLHVSCKLLNLLRCSNPSLGPNLPRAKLPRFLGRGLLPARGPWARVALPQFRWPGGLAPVSEAGGPGLGSSLARLFCVAPRWFWAAGVVFAPPSRLSTPERKHGFDALARLIPCCDAADFSGAKPGEASSKQAAIGVASEAHLRARSRFFLTNFLWFVFSFCLRARSCFFLFAARP